MPQCFTLIVQLGSDVTPLLHTSNCITCKLVASALLRWAQDLEIWLLVFQVVIVINNCWKKMKLITHNMLTSKCLKGVKEGFPLLIKASDVKETPVDFNRDFITRIVPKIEWDALYQAAENLGKSEDLPKKILAEYENDEEFLKKAHHILLEVEVVSGDLVCPETGRKFPINDGIPNMLLNEDEV